jgi:hypothetical protein
MGAGKKDENNTFTGLLMGYLPHVEADGSRSGMVGYLRGEKYYQLYDDGTLTLGAPSRAQLKFDGTESTIQNAGYGGGTGIKMDFDGDDGDQQPYINIQSNVKANGVNQRQILLQTKDPYFEIKASTTSTSTDLVPLIHIGPNHYYLQTANYVTNQSGARLDLKDGSFISNGSLTIRGGTLGTTEGIYLSTTTASNSVAINGTTLNT